MSMADKIRALVQRTAERQSVLPDPAKAKRVFPSPPPRPVVDTGYSTAIAGMIDREFIKTAKYGEQQYRADALGADPRIVEFSTVLVRRMRDIGIPMFPHCIWRNKERQDDLYRTGFSKARYPLSPHNKGCAVDIVHSTKAWDLTPRQWQVVGHMGREVAASKGFKLTWGGDDPGVDDRFSWDPAHWELSDWRDVRINPR